MSEQEKRAVKPATESDLRGLEEFIGVELPPPYRMFLKTLNGLSKDWIYLYGAQEILRQNELFNVRKNSSDYLNIGDNEGGEAYILSLIDPFPVFTVGHGSMHPDDMRQIQGRFEDWMSEGFPPPVEDSGPGFERMVDVYLERPPVGGMKSIYVIRKDLGVEVGVTHLLESIANGPFALLVNVPYGLYWERVQALNQICGDCLRISEREQ